MARIFFLSPAQVQDTHVIFSDHDVRHFISLRKKSGDIIEAVLVNPASDDKIKYTIRLSLLKGSAVGEIIEQNIILYTYMKKIRIMQCMPKLEKMDLIIQKASELGVYELIPLISKHTDIQGKIGENKLTRWDSIAREASIQSGRLDILCIQQPQNLLKFLDKNSSLLLSPHTCCIIANEFEKDVTLHSLEKQMQDPGITDIYLLIGAEGGFNIHEAQTVVETYKFHSISLGNTILRTETAPIALAAIIQYIVGVI